MLSALLYLLHLSTLATREHRPAAAMTSSDGGAQVRYVSDRPWSEENPYHRTTTYPPPQDDPLARAQVAPNSDRLQATVTVTFLPGESRKVVDVSTSLPVGKQLFLEDASLAANLPKGQRVSLVIGYKLRLDAKSQAMIGLYVEGSAVQVQILRDSSMGTGHVSLTIQGDYVKAPAP